MLNDELFERRWHEIKNLISGRWTKIRLNDIDELKGNLEKLVNLVQSAYGFARARAEMECHEFRKSLRPLLQPAVVAPATRAVHRLNR